MRISPNVNMLFEMYDVRLLHPENLTAAILLMPPLMMIALCLVQMAVSLFIRPIFSYVLTVAIMLSSAYYLSPLLPGNYAMPVRSAEMIEGGVTLRSGCATCVLLIALSVLTGMIRFRRYDIFGREN